MFRQKAWCAGLGSTNTLVLESYVAHGCNGMVVRVRSKDAAHRFPLRPYALKVCFNMGLQDTNAVRDTFRAEFEELQRLPRHPNIVALMSEFCEEINDGLFAMLRQVCFCHVAQFALLASFIFMLANNNFVVFVVHNLCATGDLTARSGCGRVGRV